MTTAVPSPTFGTNGFLIPTQQAILTGVQSDQNSAFGGDLNPALNTPQGQLASSETAIINDANSQFLSIVNGVDPAYASGRMQDALGRIYFMTRIAAASTVVSALCSGSPSTAIPLGAIAQDRSGNLYNCNVAGTIPTPSSFQASIPGATFTGAISGTTLSVSAVTGTIAIGQFLSDAVSGVAAGTYITGGSGSSWTVSISQTVGSESMTSTGSLVVSSLTSGTISVGQLVTGTGIAPGTVITGGAGLTFTINNNTQGPVASASMASSGVLLSFQCAVTGPIACPDGFLNSIYQAVSGWSGINNYEVGVPGNNVESRAAFEARRQDSVALNSVSNYGAVLASVLSVPDVLDAYVLGNPLAVISGAVIVGYIGTSSGSVPGTGLTVSSVTSGTVAIGQTVTGTGVAYGTYITGGSDSSWTVNISQAVASPTTMTCAQGGVPLAANSIYVGVSGGDSGAIAQAILNKLTPGCNMNGGTTVTAYDTSPWYPSPYPSYSIKFQTLAPTTVLFAVTLVNNSNVPQNGAALVQQVILATFAGSNVPAAARAGSQILASEYYAAIFALGPWAQLLSLFVGVGSATRTSVLIQIDEEPVCIASNITVTFV